MTSPISRLTDLRELSGSKKIAVIFAAAAIIVVVIGFLLSKSGLIGGPDSVAGYFLIQVNPTSESAKSDPFRDAIWGFERFALNGDRTFRLGGLRGTWKRSGSTLTLNPTVSPKPEEFYAKTSMAQAITILLKPSEFKISTDEKTLTAVSPTNGPIVFVKSNDIFR